MSQLALDIDVTVPLANLPTKPTKAAELECPRCFSPPGYACAHDAAGRGRRFCWERDAALERVTGILNPSLMCGLCGAEDHRGDTCTWSGK